MYAIRSYYAYIGTGVNSFATQLFRRHISEGANTQAGTGELHVLNFGNTKVQDFNATIGG